MPFFRSAAIAAGLVSMVAGAAIPAPAPSATPVQTQTPPKPVVGAAFSVEQIDAGSKLIVPPAVAMLNTYTKYKKANAAPAKVKSAAAVQTGSASAVPESWDQEYLTPVTIGGQTLNLDFDTGSSDLWVFSNEMPSSEQSGHDVYSVTSSKIMQGSTWSIGYGDGSGASGNVYADKVVVGGVTATSMAVEAATSASSSFLSDTSNDGILGLAFDNVNQVYPNAVPTFFDTVKSTLQSALFTVTLKKGAPGTFDFGYIDKSKYTGAITYVPVQSSSGYWMFTAGGYKVGNSAPVKNNIGTAIADTGTSLLYLPAKVVSNYYAQVKGAQNNAQVGGWIVPCSATLPNLSLTIGGASFTIPGSYLNYAPVGQNMCFGGAQSNAGMGFSIFGDIFLKSVFAVFDRTQSTPRLGFAAQA